MEPYYEKDGITIYNADCREILPRLGLFDLLLTDPPYGINYKAGESSQKGIQDFEKVKGDNEPFNPDFFLHFEDVICWGANNYARRLPEYGQFYFWDKVKANGLKVRIAEAEYCWHKKGTKPRGFRHLWSGAYRDSEAGMKSRHPTQKPIALMVWCIKQAGDVQTILDPFMGSGTTLVAAKQEGKTAVGIEIEEKYCEIAANRLSQGVLF